MDDQREVIAAALPAYEVGEQMGRGAFGRVFAGRHRQLDRPVAIKQLAMEYSADPEVRARFLAEARLLATLDHPQVVPVYDYVEQGGLCLLVMEKLSGGTVLSRAGADGVRMETACAVALAAASGLNHAHGRGVLHRDVKPENLLFSASGVLKVTDFGIAKVVGGAKTSITTPARWSAPPPTWPPSRPGATSWPPTPTCTGWAPPSSSCWPDGCRTRRRAT